MRIIGTLENENQARRLSNYLTRKGIENSCDVAFDSGSGHMSYQLWVHDEDQMGAASAAFEAFRSSPSDAQFDVPITEQVEVPGKEEAWDESEPPPVVTHR